MIQITSNFIILENFKENGVLEDRIYNKKKKR